jgi:hypothetical protein
MDENVLKRERGADSAGVKDEDLEGVAGGTITFQIDSPKGGPYAGPDRRPEWRDPVAPAPGGSASIQIKIG